MKKIVISNFMQSLPLIGINHVLLIAS